MKETGPCGRRPTIGVMGAGSCAPDVSDLAYDVGRLVAQSGAILLCGGLGGVMEAAARGARDSGGLVVGVLPGRDARETPPNPYVDVAIFTGMSDGRNWINACSSDAVIAIAGGYGTLSEIALAMKIGRPVVVVGSWELSASGVGEQPMIATTAAEAVAAALRGIRT